MGAADSLATSPYSKTTPAHQLSLSLSLSLLTKATLVGLEGFRAFRGFKGFRGGLRGFRGFKGFKVGGWDTRFRAPPPRREVLGATLLVEG